MSHLTPNSHQEQHMGVIKSRTQLCYFLEVKQTLMHIIEDTGHYW